MLSCIYVYVITYGNKYLSSLNARFRYRRRLFVKRIWNMRSYSSVSFGVYLHYICMYVHFKHDVFNVKAFCTYFKKSTNVSCSCLESSAYLILSRAIFPYLATRGRCKSPPHGVAAKVTGRFTARLFHSRKLPVVLEKS